MSRRLEATRRPPLKAIRRAVANTEVVPQQAARHLLIAGCGLDHAPKRASRASVLRIIRQLGFVQVDSISSVERAHHLILHARLDGYVPEMLGHHAEVSRTVFEHWTHDASIIRSDWMPWWTHRFAGSKERMLRDEWMRERLGRDWRSTIADVKNAITERGPLATRDFPRPPRAHAGWWDWSPHKSALEFLWRAGELAIDSRDGFEKVYDLAERVYGKLPQTSTRADMVAWACDQALVRLGAATAREVAQFMNAVTVAEATAWCNEQVAGGKVVRALLERETGCTIPGFARRNWESAAARVSIDMTPRLLTPFDPLTRDRTRLNALFNFDYRFEAFVPKAKRVHGYYTMPVLVGDTFIARIDLASDRAAGVLRINQVWLEPGVPTRRGGAQVKSACDRLAKQLGLVLE